LAPAGGGSGLIEYAAAFFDYLGARARHRIVDGDSIHSGFEPLSSF